MSTSITDEMIEAGKAALLACDLDNDESGKIVRAVLEAALAKSKGEPDPKAA